MAFTSFQGPDFSFRSLAPDQGTLDEQLTAWVRRATAAGRVPCVYLRASWCGANVKLEKSLDDPRMQRALRDVEVATLDVDAWVDALTAAGLTARSVPVFFILDADGRPTGASINGGAWREDVPENMAPPLEAFFDKARATRAAAPEPTPAAPVYAPPVASAAPAAPRSRVMAVALVIGSLLLIGVAAWMKVSQDEAQQREDTSERIRKEVQESVQNSLRESLKKSQQ